MPVERVDAPGLYPDAPYHYASVAGAGRMVFAAGACPLDESGRVVEVGDLEGQARRTVANLVTALAAAGAGLGDVLKTTVYVASSSQADLVRVWNVVAELFGATTPPSTLLGVSVLGYTDQLVEIEAIASAPE